MTIIWSPRLYFYCKIYFFIDEISAHTQKTTCLDIGETGRVLVTGGQDRLVNLFAIGNSQCSMVSEKFKKSREKEKYQV